jgi:hypothetical protein
MKSPGYAYAELALTSYREVSDMPPQGSPLFGHGLFLEPGDSYGSSIPEPPRLTVAEHHSQPAPADHLCTCGKIREACVNDEIRAMWSAMADPSPARPPKS